ncbi:glycine-rich domain-containing protein [Sorangium sp. So ce117]|uniref:glycine-rich domain-containing protein n=1 Tax=Sorangium sp. So ce117 TaxID=3133277 RepID=UPI003F63457F
MTTERPRVTAAALKARLDGAFFSGVVRHFVRTTGEEPAYVERQVLECLRYLYLISRYPEPLAGLFLPVEQAIDEVWHYLILQTREYSELCEERLPGRFFIHHRSLPYEDYQEGQVSREQAIEEALRWLPLYRDEFGPFDEGALPHWTMVRFLHERLGLSLEAIAALDAGNGAALPGVERDR